MVKSGLTVRGVVALLQDQGIADGHYAALGSYGSDDQKTVLRAAEQVIACREPGSLHRIASECERIAADPEAVLAVLKAVPPKTMIGR